MQAALIKFHASCKPAGDVPEHRHRRNARAVYG
jgi:hypothetical protein